MALLKSTRTEPPDGFKYLQRETETWIRGEHWEELVDLVVAHRKYKQLPGAIKEEAEIDIHRQICAGAKPGLCREEKGETYLPVSDRARSLSLSNIVTAAKTLFDWMKVGGMASLDESRSRAAICRGCPFNKEIPQCICTPLYKALEALVPKERLEPGLKICAACGCSLAAKVLVPLEVVRKDNPPGTVFPSFCWQLQSP